MENDPRQKKNVKMETHNSITQLHTHNNHKQA